MRAKLLLTAIDKINKCKYVFIKKKYTYYKA